MLVACDLLIDAGAHLDAGAIAVAGAEQLARLTRCELAVVAFEGPDGISIGSYPASVPESTALSLLRSSDGTNGQASKLFDIDNRIVTIASSDNHRGAIAAVGPIDGAFTTLEEWLVLVVARRLEAQLELAELHQQKLIDAQFVRDAVLAGEMQQALLSEPTLRVGDVELAASLRPARHVGGDIYEIAEIGGSAVGLVADVSGKGAPAAMLTTAVHAAARHAIETAGANPVEILRRLGHEIGTLLDRTDSIVTAAAAVLEPLLGTMRVASAGHSPVVVCRGGRVTLVEPSAPPAGVPNFAAGLKEVSFSLQSGDMVLLGSDGLIDQRSPGGIPFGPDRLRVAVQALRLHSATEAVDSLLRDLDRFSAGASQDDDQTALFFCVTGVGR